ncbi:MAG TPA: 2-C-methyl-D-erythritol 2,4-cyclodiphosphate synthase [Actinomycetota bacterium]|nr:2-C-methyl-D-erythritol 2,4-cyclodiphosphate synthase [Actinomycetota bacterium]
MAEPISRVGLGFDVHPWADDDRPLMLAGLHVAGERGLRGHSDGDVICHALADAVLGAGALGDVGAHFPDEEPDHAGVPGGTILRRTLDLIRTEGLGLRSCDLTVICDRPAIAPMREAMRASLARILDTQVESVSVKATRPEGLGLVGEGVGCIAVALVG